MRDYAAAQSVNNSDGTHSRYCKLDNLRDADPELHYSKSNSSPNLPVYQSGSGQTEVRGNSRKKIAVVIGSLDIGGAEKDILRNFPRLNRDLYEVLIFTFSYEGALAEEARSMGVRVISRKRCNRADEIVIDDTSQCVRSRSWPWRYFQRQQHVILRVLEIFKTVFWLKSNFQKHNVDIVHAFLPHSYLFAGFAKIFGLFGSQNYRFIMSRLSLNYYFEKHKLLSKVETKVLHRLCHKIVGNSNAILNDLIDEGVSKENLFLIYNGIETKDFYNQRSIDKSDNSDIKIISCVANLHKYKGYGDLLAAVKILSEKGVNNFKVCIAGRDVDNNLEEFEKYCAMHSLRHLVEFLGEVSDVRPLLNKSDIHVHASHTEGLPNSIIEGMSAGLPIVATAVGGIPELVKNWDNGLLVPAKDPRALAKAIEELLGNEESRIEFGERSLKVAQERFDVNISVSRYEELYASLLGIELSQQSLLENPVVSKQEVNELTYHCDS